MSKIDELFNILNKYDYFYDNAEEVSNEIKQFLDNQERSYEVSSLVKEYNDWLEQILQKYCDNKEENK